MRLRLRSIRNRDWCRPALLHLDFILGGAMKEDGYSILELLLVVAILLVISGLGAWKFMQALQAITDLLALLK
jgi:prepilin-type N-terminal cleavage/methylation domain-containing protein